MNRKQRKRLDELLRIIASAREEIEAMRDEEQDKYDNMPESFQQGERGDAMQTGIDLLDGAATALDDVESNLQGAAQ